MYVILSCIAMICRSGCCCASGQVCVFLPPSSLCLFSLLPRVSLLCKEYANMDDSVAMQLALAQACSVEGRTSPRPPVGAVVVRDGHIVGQGATAPPYGPHAEVKALEQAGEAARGSVLYVTLEPCCTQVHTPPCTAAIIASGVSRVVIAAHDPNPRIYTKGITRLRDVGIDVTLLEDCQE